MKVIFLDFDGVIVTAQTLKDRSKLEKLGNFKCIKNLNKIIRATNAKIVISSSWRFSGLNELKLILKYWGCEGEVIGMTPDLSYKDENDHWWGVLRGYEIQKWLDDNQNLNIESFVILDDHADMDHLSTNYIQTDFAVGITDIDVVNAIKLLNR